MQSTIAPNGAAVFAGEITFAVETTDGNPWVEVTATQNGVLVYEDRRVPGSTFTLGPTLSWPGGAADGHARLWHVRDGRLSRILAEADFPIAG